MGRWGARSLIPLSLTLQASLGILLGHGYDLLVGYVAARNIVHGLSPYIGGHLPNPSYPPEIQGIGETPLWPLYLSLSYTASGGDLFTFNAVSKIPILVSCLTTYALASRLGVGGASFYLLNPYVLLTSVAWGKPDLLASLAAVAALLLVERRHLSALLLAVSLNIKPLGLGLVPAIASYLGARRGAEYVSELLLLSTAIFAAPFLLLGWEAPTTPQGLSNWLSDVGGISPTNLIDYLYGWDWGRRSPLGPLIGFFWLAALGLSALAVSLRRPSSTSGLMQCSLLGSTVFILLRPSVSEQNLILPLMLLHLNLRSPPRMRLWASTLLFAALNLSIPQLLYPVNPEIVPDIYRFTAGIESSRLLAKFGASILFYSIYFSELFRVIGVCGSSRRG